MTSKSSQINARIDETYKTRPNVHIGYEATIEPYHRKIAELALKYAGESDTVIDIGCGVGHILSEISSKQPNLKLIAADIDETTLSITQQRAKVQKAIKIDTIEDLFDTGITYDVIILSHVLEHTYRPLDVLKGITSMLKPDGIAILAVPNPVRLSVFVSNIRKIHYVNRGHVYAWDRSHWMNFLENIAKLNVIEYSQDYFPLRLALPIWNKIKFKESFTIWLAQIFPWLAFSNIAVIRKG